MTTRVAVNVGNSRISCGIFVDNELVDLTHHISSNAQKAATDLTEKAQVMKAAEIAVCSVVPTVARTLMDYFRERKVTANQIKADTQNVITGVYSTLGVDRIANLAAAMKLHVRGHNAVVLDMGTATTLTAVSPQGEFLGGMITLGLGKTYATLHESTAQLPDLQFDSQGRIPTPLAKDTESAITSGCILAHVGILEAWVKAAKHALDHKCTVIATGGFANAVAPYTKVFDHVDQNLTMHGINIIAEAAKDRAGR
jgi:type III pantothenate kinase